MAVSKKKSAAANETTLRHVWLAGLGLLVIARREARAGVQRAQRAAAATQANLRDGIDSVRGQVEPKVVQFSAEVESRLAPVLDKLGLKPVLSGRVVEGPQAKAARKGRKPAAKPTPRRVARKPAAKRPARKAAR